MSGVPERTVVDASASIDAAPLRRGTPDGVSDYMLHFGLQRPPFDPADDAFFPAHGRQALLSQVLHLLHFAEAPTLVAGPPGSGKSTFLLEVERQLTEQDYVFTFSAPELSSAEDLLFRIADGIGLAVESDANEAYFKSRLAEWSDFSGGNLQVYLLLDDAEALTTDAIDCLLSLTVGASANCFHLLAVGSKVLLDKFSRQESASAAQQFEMPEVTPSFLSDYISFRMSNAGYDGPPIFDESDDEQMYMNTAGDLHRVSDSAEICLLAKMAAAESPATALPLWHLGALVLLLVVLGGAWLGLDSSSEPATNSVTVLSPAAEATRVQVLNAPSTDTPDSIQSGAAAKPASPERVSKPVSQQLAESRPAASPEAVVREDPLMHSGALQKSTEAEEDTLVAVVETPKSAPIFSEDEQFLLARPANRFTLQVLAAASKSGVDQFVMNHKALPLRVYRTLRKGEPWYVVVLGDYVSTAEARAAIQKLPKSLQKSGPWPRDMASVQQQIKINS